MFITSNTWNHVGTFMNGFDFSRSDGRDKEIEIMGNLGDQNQNPNCKINVLNNATSMTITNNWAKASWSSLAQLQTPLKFSTAANRITYQPTNERALVMWLSGNVLINTAANRTVNIAIVKNGNPAIRYGEMSIRVTASGQPFLWSKVVYIPRVQPNDYFEIWTNLSTNNTETAIFQDVNWFTNSQ